MYVITVTIAHVESLAELDPWEKPIASFSDPTRAATFAALLVETTVKTPYTPEVHCA